MKHKDGMNEVRADIGRWIGRASMHSSSVESHEGPMSEIEELYGSELSDEADGLTQRAKNLGPAGEALARAFSFLVDAWKRTGLPPTGIQGLFGLAASLR